MHKSKIQSSSDKSASNATTQARQAAAFSVDSEQRQPMIAEAAYFLAEHHGLRRRSAAGLADRRG